MNMKDARRIAFGTNPAATLEEYYQAWQCLYDNNADLRADDIDLLDKFICDGNVKPKEGYFDTIDK